MPRRFALGLVALALAAGGLALAAHRSAPAAPDDPREAPLVADGARDRGALVRVDARACLDLPLLSLACSQSGSGEPNGDAPPADTERPPATPTPTPAPTPPADRGSPQAPRASDPDREDEAPAQAPPTGDPHAERGSPSAPQAAPPATPTPPTTPTAAPTSAPTTDTGDPMADQPPPTAAPAAPSTATPPSSDPPALEAATPSAREVLGVVPQNDAEKPWPAGHGGLPPVPEGAADPAPPLAALADAWQNVLEAARDAGAALVAPTAGLRFNDGLDDGTPLARSHGGGASEGTGSAQTPTASPPASAPPSGSPPTARAIATELAERASAPDPVPTPPATTTGKARDAREDDAGSAPEEHAARATPTSAPLRCADLCDGGSMPEEASRTMQATPDAAARDDAAHSLFARMTRATLAYLLG